MGSCRKVDDNNLESRINYRFTKILVFTFFCKYKITKPVHTYVKYSNYFRVHQNVRVMDFVSAS